MIDPGKSLAAKFFLVGDAWYGVGTMFSLGVFVAMSTIALKVIGSVALSLWGGSLLTGMRGDCRRHMGPAHQHRRNAVQADPRECQRHRRRYRHFWRSCNCSVSQRFWRRSRAQSVSVVRTCRNRDAAQHPQLETYLRDSTLKCRWSGA